MGAWSPRGATGWCSTPGVVANNNGLAVEAYREDREAYQQAGNQQDSIFRSTHCRIGRNQP